jgi:hypothetical protein
MNSNAKGKGEDWMCIGPDRSEVTIFLENPGWGNYCSFSFCCAKVECRGARVTTYVHR